MYFQSRDGNSLTSFLALRKNFLLLKNVAKASKYFYKTRKVSDFYFAHGM